MSFRRYYRFHHSRGGFTLLELFFVILIIAVLLGMLLPTVRRVREPARRTACMNNLRQLVLAALNYESAHGTFPAAMGRLNINESGTHEGADRLSGFCNLIPYWEQNQLWETISNPSIYEGVQYPAGPAPWDSSYPPWQEQHEGFICASSVGGESVFGQINYVFCVGDMARNIHNPKNARGAFACGIKTRIDDIVDGTSNTIAMAEIGTKFERNVIGQYAIDQSAKMLDDPSRCLQLLDAKQVYKSDVTLSKLGRGGNWADGAAGNGLFNTILPPNSPSCAVGGELAVDGIYSAGSLHPGGVNIAMLDGSTRFIRENIDTGDSGQPTPIPSEMFAEQALPSPYGVWGALGTVAGEEELDDSDW